MNIGSLLTRHAQYRPSHLAVVVEDQRLTFVQFNQRVNRLANTLIAAGISKGDKVATILQNSLELLDIYWAVAKIGAVAVPLSPLLRGHGLARLLHDSHAVLVVTEPDFIEHLEPVKVDISAISPDRYILIEDRRPGYMNYDDMVASASTNEPPAVEIQDEDPYNIMYSSGTTGLPKGIVLTHRVRALYATLFASSYRMTPESIILHAGSLVFNGAFLTLMPAMFLGATYILHRQFDPVDLIDTIQREKVTHTEMVPSQIIAMLNAPNFSGDALRSLEMVGTAGAPFHLAYRLKLNEALPGRFYELYGMTEGFMTILDKAAFEAKPELVGTPPPFHAIRIVDNGGHDLPPLQIGEIIGKSPLLMAGYYNQPDLTAQAITDGWMYSGDLGYVDEDGFLFLVDRKKDMIISGAVNVYPRDIEEILVTHPAVREVAIFGVQDDKWGETPVAAVILRQPNMVSAEALRDWVNERVEARYQRVSHLYFLDDFPRNAAGKTLKRILRDEYLDVNTLSA